MGEAFAKASAAGRFQFGRAGEREGVSREAQVAGELAEAAAARRLIVCGEPVLRRAPPARSALRVPGAPVRGHRVGFATELVEVVAIPGRDQLPSCLWHVEPGAGRCL